jgi:hypothetical protein
LAIGANEVIDGERLEPVLFAHRLLLGRGTSQHRDLKRCLVFFQEMSDDFLGVKNIDGDDLQAASIVVFV